MAKQKLKRNVSVGFRVTEEERSRLDSLMEQAGVKSVRAFFFKMMADTVVVRIDLSDIRALTKELHAIGVNLNQLARRANETGSVHSAGIEDILSRLDGSWNRLSGVLKNLSKL